MNRAALVSLLRANGVRRAPRRLRVVRRPDAVAGRYFKALDEGPLRLLRDLVEERLVPRLRTLAARASDARGQRADAEGDDEIAAILDELAEAYAARWTRQNAAQLAEAIGRDVERAHAYELNAALHDLLGVDVVGNEPWIADMLREFSRENVALIRSLPRTFFDKIETMVTHDLADGVRWEEIAGRLQDELGVTERRANLIARDQAGKLFGDLQRTRQSELGVDGYVWRTMRDNRVRDSHEARNGRRYTWDRPPVGGHPGEAVLCRCYAEPDLAPLLREAGVDLRGTGVEG